MNSDTLLLRQINLSWIQDDRATSQAFTPTPKDQHLLSVYDGDQITPEDSWRHFTHALGYVSAGVMAVTVGECGDQGREVRPDPTAFQEHAVIDFTSLNGSEVKSVGKALARCANTGGWQYRPPLET